MKRTILLIIFLLISASLLIFYALNSSPSKPQDKSILIPTESLEKIAPNKNYAEITFFPESIVLTSTDSATFDIVLDTKNNKVTGVQLEIGYDPAIVSDLQIQKSTFLSSASILINENDNVNGRISYAIVLPPTQPPVTGSGNIAKLSLRKNVNITSNTQAKISILPKSLITALGVEGSVLGKTKDAIVTFSYFSPTTNLSNSSVELTPTISQ